MKCSCGNKAVDGVKCGPCLRAEELTARINGRLYTSRRKKDVALERGELLTKRKYSKRDERYTQHVNSQGVGKGRYKLSK